MQEIWKDIQGYEGLYQVSNLGNVKSLKVGRNYLREESQYKQVILKKRISTSGYYRVELYAPNTRKCYYVHRLVALAFIPNPQNKREVNHIDGNKLNNNVNNLEWVTISENQLHAIKLGLRKASPMEGRKGILSSIARPIIQYTLDGEFVKIWDCASDAGRFLNKNPTSITSCARHESLSAYGYMWRYLDSSPLKLNIEPYNRNTFLRKKKS